MAKSITLSTRTVCPIMHQINEMIMAAGLSLTDIHVAMAVAALGDAALIEWGCDIVHDPDVAAARAIMRRAYMTALERRLDRLEGRSDG